MTDIDLVYLRRLRILGVIEGCSTLLLFGVAMPLKYLADMPMAVTIVGSLHGFLFIALAAMFFIGKSQVPLSTRITLAGILGAVVPFGPFVVDVYLGRIAAAARQTEPAPAA